MASKRFTRPRYVPLKCIIGIDCIVALLCLLFYVLYINLLINYKSFGEAHSPLLKDSDIESKPMVCTFSCNFCVHWFIVEMCCKCNLLNPGVGVTSWAIFNRKDNVYQDPPRTRLPWNAHWSRAHCNIT